MRALALLLASLLQETIDNPEYKGWATFKPGSSVTYKYSTPPTLQKTTLKSVNETEVVVQTEISADGTWTGKGAERKIPAKLSAELAPKNVKEGEEEIEVAGKTIKCKTREWDKILPSGKKSTIKVWATNDIPGKGAQVLALTEGNKFQMTAVEWETK